MNNEPNAFWQRNGITKLKICGKTESSHSVDVEFLHLYVKRGPLLLFALRDAVLFMITCIYLKKSSVGLSFLPDLFSLFLEFRWHFCYKTATMYKLEEYSGY